ncbi:hypothetical protein C8J57DRAFT_1327435 [Mycena rebaudengoi]|nr:hypothetical protein C8J57DRAFT_1327435 [Mycena rebaudengoi]
MFFSKALVFLGAVAMLAVSAVPQTSPRHAFSLASRSLHATRELSGGMLAALEARDPVLARCAQTSKRDCPYTAVPRFARFMQIAHETVDKRICLGCCGDSCTCGRATDIVCAQTEDEFVERAYEAAKRDVELLPRCIL